MHFQVGWPAGYTTTTAQLTISALAAYGATIQVYAYNRSGMPIYLGQSTPKSRQVVREGAEGELAITPKTLLFNGPQQSADIDLDKITALDIAIDGITVSVKGRQKPFIFVVPNGLLWGMLVKNLIQIQVEGRALPSGAKLQLL